MNTAEIIESIDRRLEQIQREVDSLRRTRATLTNGAGVRPTRRNVRTVDAQNKRAGGRRVLRRRAVSTGDLERLLGENEPLSTGALADRAGADRDRVLVLLKELEAEGRVRRLGTRRATRWRLYSEEEAIAERAAELAARSKAAAAERRG